MADGMSLEVEGLEETQSKMERLVAELKGNEVEQGIRTATMLVQRQAKINATTFPKVQTGRLRASITPEVRRLGETNIEGVVGSNVEYAPYQELGTVYIAPREYLRRALESNRDKIVNLVNDVIAKLVSNFQ